MSIDYKNINMHAKLYADHWKDRDDCYWFTRLVEEVGELGASLANDHPHTPEHELTQIASIAMNWLKKREGEFKK